jgi:DnaJ-class molecular chaperone
MIQWTPDVVMTDDPDAACESCDGSGEVATGHPDPWTGTWDTETCHDCAGTGRPR